MYIQDENNCIIMQSFSIEEVEPTELEFNEPEIDCATDQVILMVTPSDDSNITYQWSNGASTDELMVDQSGIYELEIDDGCSVRTHQWDIKLNTDHTVDNPAYIPNIFTPESLDGNNGFKPEIHEDIEILTYRFMVFDRWGNKMFDTENELEYWMGVFNNKEVGPGVFVWKVELEYTKCFEPIVFEKYGDVTLSK